MVNLKKLTVILTAGFVLTLISSTFLMTKMTSAASLYDSTITPTTTLMLRSHSLVHQVDITNSYTDFMRQYCSPTIWSAFVETVGDVDGNWAVLQDRLHLDGHSDRVFVIFTTDQNATTMFYPIGTPTQYNAKVAGSGYFVGLGLQENGNGYCNTSTIQGLMIGSSVKLPGQEEARVFSSTYPVTYPSGYEGEEIPGGHDIDGDGLHTADENTQGTSDLEKDTDGDGLSDYIESTSFSNRTSVFCGVPLCAYPDPLVKDVYVELDWMSDSANSRLLKPSGAQLAYVESMFDDKSINMHVDTGQYGGGNVLPLYSNGLRTEATSGVVDFGDFKDGGDSVTANFAANRHSIWKYMIYGYGYIKSGDPNYPAISGSSGLAEVSGDDIFVAGGIVEDSTGLVSLDRAVANTIAHEIGHTLCLSSTPIYQEQNAGCVYNGIDSDSYKPENYLSVMNYRYQLTDDDDMGVVDYSDGTNGSGDHDDWSGVFAGMKDFNGTQTQLGSKRVFAKNKTMDPDKIVQETLPVRSDNFDPRQTNLPLLASVQPPTSPTNTSFVSDTVDMQVKRPSLRDDTVLDWKVIGFVVLGGMGTLAWHALRRK